MKESLCVVAVVLIAIGAYFWYESNTVRCPKCSRPMTVANAHKSEKTVTWFCPVDGSMVERPR